ncbi:putative basic amino acid antiporter YfcC [Bacillus aerolatus]|uniref:Putative basic amino acid antiporter YfcC n=1 Tax=Bacillus aerolatus TaxID=2653354 RepID=A0A6I1FFI8_9BACI|nr:SLC13 family permease [Bacillus aerolatus]KAB7706715.1 putative basic amino acid antiporter YfcC [Bacillus aerolatus]
MKPEPQLHIEAEEARKPKKKFEMPHIYVILFIMMVIMAALTYLIPAGQFDRVDAPIEGRTVIEPDTFTKIEANPVGLKSFMTAIPKGLVQSADIIFFVFAAGGAFTVLMKTGIIEIGVDKLARRFAKNSILLVPILMIVFGLLSTFAGLPELSLVYVPIILPLMLAVGYDSLTAVAIALIATCAGFTSSITNPMVGISQSIAELPLFSGAGYRTIIFVVTLAIGTFFVMRYANKVKKNPELSLMYKEDTEKRKSAKKNLGEPLKATRRQTIASIAAAAFLGLLVYGVLKHGWYMIEIAGIFISLAVVVGLIAGLKITEVCEEFNEGCKAVFLGAFIIGVSRAIVIIMEEGQIMDTVVYGLAQVLGSMPDSITILGMYVGNTLLNFLIPSGSGQALVTLPIMAPLADILGITRQTAVVAFHLGDGLSNIFYPTVGYFMATLAIAGVSWTKWVRFFFPLGIAWVLVSAILLLIAQAIDLGPF